MSGGIRFSLFFLGCSLLFVALKFFKSRGRGKDATNIVGLVLAFLAGSTFLLTFIGDWVRTAAGWGLVGVCGLIVCGGIIIVDWMLDKKPDMPAFFAALLIPMFIVFGAAQIPTATSHVKTGVDQVGNQMTHVGDKTPAKR